MLFSSDWFGNSEPPSPTEMDYSGHDLTLNMEMQCNEFTIPSDIRCVPGSFIVHNREKLQMFITSIILKVCSCSLFTDPEITKVTRVIEGDPTFTTVTKVIETEPIVTKVVVKGEPVVTKVTRVIEGKPIITKVTRVIEGKFLKSHSCFECK